MVAEADIDADGVSSLSWLNFALVFFNLGKVPLMVFLTFLALPFWAISILLNHYLSNDAALLSALYLIPAFIAALFFLKILTMPFVKILVALEKEHESAAIIIG